MTSVARRRHLMRDVKHLLRQEEATSLVPAAFFTFAILDAIPIPTDIGYFYVQRWLEENRDRLSKRDYWIIEALAYYGFDVLWYASLGTVTYLTGKSITQKMLTGLGLVSAGAIVTMIWQFSHPKANELDRRSPAQRQTNPTIRQRPVAGYRQEPKRRVLGEPPA